MKAPRITVAVLFLFPYRGSSYDFRYICDSNTNSMYL